MVGLGNSVDAGTTGFQSLNASTGVWNGRTLTAGTGISITNPDGTAGNPTISFSGAAASSVVFESYKSATTANATGAGVLVSPIIFDTVVTNLGGGYNSGTGVFTAPSTGDYQFNLGLGLTNLAAANTNFFSRLNVNGGTIFTVPYTANAANMRGTGNDNFYTASQIIHLTAGDTVVAEVAVGGGAQVVGIFGSAMFQYTSFSGFLVSTPTSISVIGTTPWTPTITFGGTAVGLTYASQFGWYTQVGDIVTAYFHVNLSNKGTSVGNAAISNLPITAGASNLGTVGNFQCNAITFPAGSTYITSTIQTAPGTELEFIGNGSVISGIVLTNAHFVNTSDIAGTIIYTVN